MKKQHWSEVAAADVPAPASKVKIRWLIDETTGARTFAMRMFEIVAGGSTPLHAHDWEHEVFIVSGSGSVACAEGDVGFAPGDVVFMPGGEKHSFKNTGAAPVRMLCLVPLGPATKR